MSMFRKAYTAAGVTLAGAFGAALTDGHLTVTEALVALGAALLAGAGVYGVANRPASPAS